MTLEPKKDIIQYFDKANNLYEGREEAHEKIDQMIELLSGVEVDTISGGYFYNCKDTPGLCEYDNDDKVYVSPHQISTIKNEEYEELIEGPITSVLYELGGAMTNIDLYYPLLFKINNAEQIEQYEKFQKRIREITLYVKPTIDTSRAPHENAINYLNGLKSIIENNLPEVLDAYNHHVETLREAY